jgi:hypothetical protein
VSPELIGTIFTGMTALLASVAALMAGRNKRISDDGRYFRRQARYLQRKVLAALGHIFLLEHELAERGLPIPPRPEILEGDDDDDAAVHAR